MLRQTEAESMKQPVLAMWPGPFHLLKQHSHPATAD
jgi:hypothetical protein